MHSISARTLGFITDQLNTYRANAYTPFSESDESAIIVLENGSWIPGVRVESASFSLTISALLNSYTTARAFGEHALSLVCMSRPFTPAELAYLQGLDLEEPLLISDSICSMSTVLPEDLSLSPIQPWLSAAPPQIPATGIQLTRKLTSRAHVPYSDFPVACILETSDGLLLPGVNVEHSDWSQILCAERNALSTAITYGHRSIKNIYLTCTRDHQCTPCGACRQLLAELTPEAVLWMDRGIAHEESATPNSLLPAWFSGSTLINNMSDC